MNRAEILTGRLDSIGIAKSTQTGRRGAPFSKCLKRPVKMEICCVPLRRFSQKNSQRAKRFRQHCSSSRPRIYWSAGIGKTTTIAKLATGKTEGRASCAHYTRHHSTCCRGSTYAIFRGINVPLTVVARPSELTEALENIESMINYTSTRLQESLQR